MTFAVANLAEVFEPHRSALFEFVRNGVIRSQEELDRATNWLAAELRINNSLTK